MDKIVQDLKYSVRMLAQSPAFSAIAVVTLALGIGANTAIFSTINSVLLRPLPFREPDRLVQLFETEAAPGNYPFAGPDYLDWQAQNRTLEGMTLHTWPRRYNASGAGEPESAVNVGTEANFFSVLGVQPLIGRTFSTGEDQEGKDRVAILSYGFWQRHFGGMEDALGKSVELNSEAYTVVGVMPRWFNYPTGTEIWTPFDMSPKNLGPRGSHSYRALGRLKAGVTVSQAQTDLSIIAKRLEKQFPDSNDKIGAAVFSMKDMITRSSREQLLVLLGAVSLVLLVACANVANLLLARATGRQREVAVRAALGASRWRLIRQMLTESLLLSFAGAAAGLAAAWWCVKALQTARSLPIPRINPVQIDARVLLFTLALSVFVALFFGIAPALQASGLNLSEELKSSAHAVLSPSGRRRFLRDALVVAEISVSMALLIGAGLLLRSFEKMRSAEIGVQTRHVLTMGINLPGKRYSTLEQRREFFDRLLQRTGALPGVEAVTLSSVIPLEGGWNGYIVIPGRDDAAIKNQLFEWNYITPEYFRTFGISFLQGRNFSAAEIDRAAGVSIKLKEIYSLPSPPKTIPDGLSFVAVINRAMARLGWPGQDPIGKRFELGGSMPVTVVGVVTDVKEWGIRENVVPQAYFPLTAALSYLGNGNLTVKTIVPPMKALGSVRTALNGLDSSLALIRPRTMDDVISDSMQDTSLQTLLLGVFAGVAVLLAAVGLYSVMGYLVSQRRHEIGIRMALGAGRGTVMMMVFSQGSRLILAGTAAGIGGALWLSRLIRGLLFGVPANDVVTFAAVPVLLVCVALLACYFPARRATRVDPIVALRCD